MNARQALAVITLLVGTARAQEGNSRAESLARRSGEVEEAHASIERQAKAIHDPAIAAAVRALLARPLPTFLDGADAATRERLRAELVAAKLLDPAVTVGQLLPPLPAGASLWAAPGQAAGGHHSHPGGLLEHTAFNLDVALRLEAAYAERYGVKSDHDVIVAAPILHDLFKCWLLAWRSDGTLTPQAKLAGTAAHHPLIVAEAIYRRLPPRLVVALAAAHDMPLGDSAAKTIGYLRAGAILARVDPVAAGILKRDPSSPTGFAIADPPSVEAAVSHLSDHDWILTDPSAPTVVGALRRLLRAAAPALDEAGLTWATHRVQSQIAGVTLYALWARGGDEAIRAELTRRKIPLASDEDRAGR